MGGSSDALCHDDVIDVDDLDSTHNKDKAGNINGNQHAGFTLEVSSLMLHEPKLSNDCCHTHFTLQQVTPSRHLLVAILPFHLQPLPSDLQQTIGKEPHQ